MNNNSLKRVPVGILFYVLFVFTINAAALKNLSQNEGLEYLGILAEKAQLDYNDPKLIMNAANKPELLSVLIKLGANINAENPFW